MQKEKQRTSHPKREFWAFDFCSLNADVLSMVLTPLFCAALPDLYLSYLWAAQKPLNVFTTSFVKGSNAYTSFIFTNRMKETFYQFEAAEYLTGTRLHTSAVTLWRLKNSVRSVLGMFSQNLIFFTGKINHIWSVFFKNHGLRCSLAKQQRFYKHHIYLLNIFDQILSLHTGQLRTSVGPFKK